MYFYFISYRKNYIFHSFNHQLNLDQGSGTLNTNLDVVLPLKNFIVLFFLSENFIVSVNIDISLSL